MEHPIASQLFTEADDPQKGAEVLHATVQSSQCEGRVASTPTTIR